MKVTEELANFVVDTDYDKLPRDVREHVKLCILDWLGCALAGSLEAPARIVASIVRETGGREESTVIGAGFKTCCVNAALANGTSGHAVELDDIHDESIIHPAAPVVPAALAVAERIKASGRDLIAAIALGYEVEIRIGIAVNPSHYRFWHTTSTCGTFGAAAASGKILGLDSEKIVNSFGIAGTQAAGLIEVFGTMSKPLGAGRAAANGVLAALLAEKGFTSSRAMLDSEKGFCRATSAEYNPGVIVEGLGRKFHLLNNVFKIHASCGHTHGAIDAVLLLRNRYGIKPEDVDEIVVKTYPIAADVVGKNYEPTTPYEAKFSLPFCVAVALIYGKVSLSEFRGEVLSEPEVREVSKKVKVVADPEYANVRLGSAKVTIRTNRGEFSCRVDVPKGYPRNPLTRAELEGKFLSLASLAMPSERADEVLKMVVNLEKIEDVTLLTSLLRT